MPRLAHVLIYDSDSRGRETLVYGFEGEGVKAAAAAARAELPLLIASARPQVLILTVRDDSAGAIELIRSLLETPDSKDIPRLLLAPPEGLPEELRASSSFIPLPAFVRDVITAAKLLAGGSPRPGTEVEPGRPEGSSELTGALSEYGLYFIVRTMVGLRRSGFVQVERGNRKGELRFSEGDVVSAQVGSLQGHAALHQLLLWEEAALEIKFRPVVRLGQSLPSGEDLLDDCERFLRDFSHATKNVGHAQSLFVQDAERVARLLDTIPAEVVPVMRLFDGQRSLGDVLEDSPFRVFDTLRTITRLLDMGIIRRKAIERPTTGLGHLRRGRGDEWIRPGAAESPPSPAAEASPAAAPEAGGDEAEADQRVGLFTRRRSPRRRGEEVPAPPGIAPPGNAAEQASVSVVAPLARPAPAPPSATSIAVHGELRVPTSNQPPAAAMPDVPKVVIDFGMADEEAARTGRSADPSRAATARTGAVRSAEFQTGGRAPVTPAPPAEGPSIMLDPRLLAEMDALEQTQPPPAPAPPVRAPAPSPPAAPASPAAVVSFVHAKAPMPSSVPLSAAPTISVSPVAHGEDKPGPGLDMTARRASGEFDAVESDFFAREAEIYSPEASEQPEGPDTSPGVDSDDPRPR
jgi:hypothetical protein